jgi:hypothetical protein
MLAPKPLPASMALSRSIQREFEQRDETRARSLLELCAHAHRFELPLMGNVLIAQLRFQLAGEHAEFRTNEIVRSEIHRFFVLVAVRVFCRAKVAIRIVLKAVAIASD